MKKRTLRILAFVIAFCMVCLAAAGCGRKAGEPGSTSAAVTESTARAESQAETGKQAETEKQTETEAQLSPETQEEPQTETESAEREPVYYTMDDVEALEHTENFSGSAIEHIFNGTVNSSGKGSGYHYDMIEDSDGEIIDGTRSEEDINGLYTAYIEVSGHKKSHYSTFFPDSWSPQEVVDAINAAREDALENDRHQGTTWIGYYEDIEIDMYFDTKDRIVSAFPVYEDDRH